MYQLDYKRLVIEKIVMKIKEETIRKRRNIKTVDPVIKIGRELYPFLSEKEIQDYACTALRIIFNNQKNNYFQTTLE